MELRHLKYFVKAAETLNFSEAAKALAVTQSTLSQQLRQLEAEMNVQLFQRNSHAVVLTEAGRELLPYAIETLYSAESCFNRLEDLKNLLSGTLNIGVTYSFSPMLTETLITFMKKYPGVKLNIYYQTMDELMTRLIRREVDFVLAFRPTSILDSIESHPLFDNRLSVIVRNAHPLADKRNIVFSDLQNYDLALPAKGLQARNSLDKLLTVSDYGFNVRVEINEVNILLKLIKQTNLVTILADATIYGDDQVTAIPLTASGSELDGCVHLLRNSYRKRSELEFIKMLRQSDAIRERMDKWIV